MAEKWDGLSEEARGLWDMQNFPQAEQAGATNHLAALAAHTAQTAQQAAPAAQAPQAEAA
jgi:hypothetical protein